MIRRLSQEDRALWSRLRRTVRPLRKRSAEEDTEEAVAAEDVGDAAAVPSPPRKASAAPASRSTPALQPFEERTRRRLARGLTDVDARIDLHGMRQERAFRALSAFLRQAKARGVRIALVITGKGRAEDEEGGVLKKTVPLWLARPDFRELVVGFEGASRRHGGGGAFYVRIRQRREARRPASE
jgi:DNA-nicking Smr family endonuclease